jgi:hypothetical protein
LYCRGSYYVVFFGTEFNITPLISTGRDMSEAILNPVKKTHTHTHTHTQGSKNLFSSRDQVAKLFIGGKFLTSVSKV